VVLVITPLGSVWATAAVFVLFNMECAETAAFYRLAALRARAGWFLHFA
jgi:hypothetical protein